MMLTAQHSPGECLAQARERLGDKRPRQYAAEIIALPSIDARRAALAAVPDWCRETVKHYVSDHWNKRRASNGG